MSKLVAYIGLGIAVLIWGISFISIDIVLHTLTVSELNIVRFTIVNMVLWIIQWIRPYKLKIQVKDMPLITLAGILGTAGYYYFENLSLTMISPGIVSVVTGAIPITTLVIAMLFFGKKTRFRNISFICLSFIGIIILMNPFSGGESSGAMGVSVVMLANVFWSLYTLFNEHLNRKYDKLQLLTVQYTAGMIAFYCFYLHELSEYPDLEPVKIATIVGDPTVFGHVIFICIFASIVAYFFYNYALAHLSVMISALFINVVPVVTLIVSVGFGYETLDFSKVMGCLFVVIAIFFIEDI